MFDTRLSFERQYEIREILFKAIGAEDVSINAAMGCHNLTHLELGAAVENFTADRITDVPNDHVVSAFAQYLAQWA